MKNIPLTLVLIFVLLQTQAVYGAIIHVPGDYETIQRGINHANVGDTVLVASGTYMGAENREIEFGGKAISVMSQNGAANCIIDCEEHTAYNFDNNESENSILQGFTIRNCAFRNGIVCLGSSPTIKDCVLRDSNIYCCNWSDHPTNTSPKILSCLIVREDADYNDTLNQWFIGIKIDSATPIIQNCTISGCNYGIMTDRLASVAEGTLEISECTFRENQYGIFIDGEVSDIQAITNCSVEKSLFYGVYLQHSDAVITNCHIKSGNGNGIFMRYYSSPIIIGCTVQDNEKTGIACDGASKPTITDCQILANVNPENFDSHGGGISCSGAVIRNSEISGNSSEGYGGGIYIHNSVYYSLEMEDCIISDNRAKRGGAGIFVGQGSDSSIIKYSTIANNKIENTEDDFVYGGGIYFGRGSHTIIGCTVTRNSIVSVEEDWARQLHGGGIASVGYSNMFNCTITDNYVMGPNTGDCNNFGGGLFIGSSSSLSNCTIAGNTVYSDGNNFGAAIYVQCDNFEIANCLINKNTALGSYYSLGGGLYAQNTNVVIENCTFSENTADDGGAYYCAESTSSIINCILWNDTPSELSFTTIPEITYSNIQGEYQGEGNISADPLFVSGPWGNYHLSEAGQQPDSPCINAGSDLAENICFELPDGEICLDELTTRTDLVTDTETVNMGRHYPPVTPTPTPTPSPTPTSTTPPTYTPPPTPECTTLGCKIYMPSNYYRSGDLCYCYLGVCNPTQTTYSNIPVFVILDVYGTYYFAPSFTDYDHYPATSIYPGLSSIEVLPQFNWPSGAGSASGIFWYAAMLTQDFSDLFGELDPWEFGWGS